MKYIFKYTLYIFAAIGFIMVGGFFAIKLGMTNEKGIIDNQRNSFIDTKKETNISPVIKSTVAPQKTIASKPYFTTTTEWAVLKEAILADKEPILRAAETLSVEPRIIVSILIVEQLRLYNDNREIFKTIFAPLKILGNQSQFSWGVLGIKQETARETEEHLTSTSSPFYLGERHAHILDFKTNDHDSERFERIVNEHNRYYSYLYGAVIIKQLTSQWDAAGYSISRRPEILATLFNIGFKHSSPHENPSSGGATITLNEKTYSFGGLAQEFYYSNELIDVFPRKN